MDVELHSADASMLCARLISFSNHYMGASDCTAAQRFSESTASA